MQSTTARIAGILAGAALVTAVAAAPAFADETTVIKQKPGSYSETREGHGSHYKFDSNGVRTKEVYDGHGVQSKTESDGVKTKHVYKDGDCQKKAVSNAASGESKVVAEGNCP